MAIEKLSETATHDDTTVGYWLSETDERKAIFERGRQAGLREGIEAAIEKLSYSRLNPSLPRAARTEFMQAFDNGLGYSISVLEKLLPDDAQNTSE